VLLLSARVRAQARSLAALGGDPRVLERLAALERTVSATTDRLDAVDGRLERLQDQAARCLQHVGLVRYDALKSLGGHLSFSLALLDGRRDGVVLSVLNDRDGARAYAKAVEAGRSPHALSEEEQRAIAQV
jgi:hypothetical protein